MLTGPESSYRMQHPVPLGEAFNRVGISHSTGFEDGFEPLFVQQQVGHAWASTTAIYTGVGSDFKNKALRDILDRRLGPPAGREA